jgi:hypothetical protein
MTGDFTVQGGDITLGGTGRIQGVDTVSANTDAANKLYVDNAVSGAGSGTFLPLTGGTLTGPLVIDTAGGAEKMTFNNEFNTAPIADSFSGNTSKSYISFAVVSGSNDPGFIMHESSATETNEGVLHLCPSDDNSTGDYVSIHGSNDPDVLNLHTSGLIETVNLQLQIKSGSGNVYLNDSVDIANNLLVSGTATITSDLTVNGGDITLAGTGRIQGVDTVSASTDAANKAYVDASVPTVNNGTLTMTTSTGLDGSATFTANQSGNSTFAVTLDLTEISLGAGLDSTATGLSLDLSEFTDMTATMLNTDEFIVLDNGAERRKAAGEIGNSIFSNTAGYITSSSLPTVNNATITIAAGTNLTTGGNFTTNQGSNETITINMATGGVRS